jgi:type IV pilus assembly protein PilC
MAATRTFAYRGRDAAGKLVKGTVDAATESAVTTRLRTMGVAPISVAEAQAGTGLNREIDFSSFRRGVGLKDLAVMSRQMATMISAGLTLLRTLTIVSEQTENKRLAEVLAQVSGDVETGLSLSDAMARHPDEFPPLMLSLLRAGETGGFLEGALESIAANFEKEVELRGTIRSALTYPVVVLAMAVLAVIGMLLFIVPIFEKMFADLGGELPLPTQVLVVLSKNMAWAAPLLAVAGGAFALWWRRNRNTLRVRMVVDPLRLRMPVFGPLLTKVAVARFTRNFATMMSAGVPILRALSIVGATSGNWVIERALVTVQDSVRQGSTVAAPLAEEPVFPSMVTQMIAVGEDSGALEQMLHKISDFYDQEVKSTTEQLTALIEPLMIAAIGIVIGGMIVALYMPVFTIFGQIT